MVRIPSPKAVVIFGVNDLTGASRMGLAYLAAFRRAGTDVVAIAPPELPADFGGAESFANLNATLETWKVPLYKVPGLDRLASLSACREMVSILRREQVGLIVSMHQNALKYAAYAARRTGIPHVSSRQGPVLMYGGKLARWIKGIIFGLCLRQGTTFSVCTNSKDRDQLLSEYGVDPAKVRVVANGVDIVGFPEEDPVVSRRLRSEFCVEDQGQLWVNVGRLDPQKDQLTLIRAWSAARPFPPGSRLVLVGNVTAIGTANAERYAETLKAEVARLGLQNEVVFAGWRNDVAAILHAGDVYVHSASWEGLPLAMCEALAARKAFIGTDCFGIPQGWRQGETGWFVPKEDPAALGAAMKEVASLSAEKRRAIGNTGRSFSEAHFDIRVVSDLFAAQASQFLARPGSAG